MSHSPLALHCSTRRFEPFRRGKHLLDEKRERSTAESRGGGPREYHPPLRSSPVQGGDAYVSQFRPSSPPWHGYLQLHGPFGFRTAFDFAGKSPFGFEGQRSGHVHPRNNLTLERRLHIPDYCARRRKGLAGGESVFWVIWVAIDAHFRVQERKFDKLLTDVLLLTLSQAIEQEVGGRRTETE